VLVDYLEAFPTDAEAWCELAELYQALGLSSQATFSLEEALLITPNSWSVSEHCLLSPYFLHD
jgi:cytochrome c-type biogenesis protein CcmH/NrfG